MKIICISTRRRRPQPPKPPTPPPGNRMPTPVYIRTVAIGRAA